MPKPDMLPLEEVQGQNCKRNVLVAVSGSELDAEAVTLACNAAKAKKSNVFAVFGIQVPRTLPIDAEMQAETEDAGRALERASGVAAQMHLHLQSEIVQSRDYGQSLIDEAVAHECALLILGLPYHLGPSGHFALGEAAEHVLKNAPCRVWLVRGQRSEVAPSAPSTANHLEGVGAIR